MQTDAERMILLSQEAILAAETVRETSDDQEQLKQLDVLLYAYDVLDSALIAAREGRLSIYKTLINKNDEFFDLYNQMPGLENANLEQEVVVAALENKVAEIIKNILIVILAYIGGYILGSFLANLIHGKKKLKQQEEFRERINKEYAQYTSRTENKVDVITSKQQIYPFQTMNTGCTELLGLINSGFLTTVDSAVRRVIGDLILVSYGNIADDKVTADMYEKREVIKKHLTRMLQSKAPRNLSYMKFTWDDNVAMFSTTAEFDKFPDPLQQPIPFAQNASAVRTFADVSIKMRQRWITEGEGTIKTFKGIDDDLKRTGDRIKKDIVAVANHPEKVRVIQQNIAFAGKVVATFSKLLHSLEMYANKCSPVLNLQAQKS